MGMQIDKSYHFILRGETMEIIEMPWELNNLGVSSIEFRFDGTEDIRQIDSSVYENQDYEYQVCRIPANCMDLAYFLQDNGFRYSETAFELSADLRKESLPGLYKNYLDMFDYHIADKDEILKVDEIIRRGVFDTDRIALDPFFDLEKSGRRFENWFAKELDAGSSKCYIVDAMSKDLGFFVLKENSNTEADSFLAALFDQKDKGMGFSVIYYPLVQARKEGKKKIKTRVSSNNLNSLKTHLEIGYKLKHINYLFIKHVETSVTCIESSN